jgi:uncharacterized ParB-like nuclease family protein
VLPCLGAVAVKTVTAMVYATQTISALVETISSMKTAMVCRMTVIVEQTASSAASMPPVSILNVSATKAMLLTEAPA